MKPVPVRVFSTNDSITRYRTWKEENAPLVYDWLSYRSLTWPHGALQWGALTHNGLSTNNNNNTSSSFQASSSFASNAADQQRNNPSVTLPLPAGQSEIKSFIQDQQQQQHYATQAAWSTRSLFLAERTDNNPGDPNTLLQYDVRVIHELVNKHNDICKPWIEDSHASSNRDSGTNREFTLRKRVIHPGEVNRIRLVTPNVVLTHTDSPNLFLWDMDKQVDRKKTDLIPNKPTAELSGHMSNAEFAIDVYPSGAMNHKITDARILSGGHDHHVCLWHLADYEALDGKLEARGRFGGNYVSGNNNVGHHANLAGHSDVVDDVSFQRHAEQSSGNVFVSVGRDAAIILWDSRLTPRRPTEKLVKGHESDINCCDFGGIEGTNIITGGNDSVIRVWDIRKLRGTNNQPCPQYELIGHRGMVTNLSWNRFERNVFASGADDGEILIWRLSGDKTTVAAAGGGGGSVNLNNNGMRKGGPYRPSFDQVEGLHSDELIFRHVGHNFNMVGARITDLDWLPSPYDRWCLASISEPFGSSGGSTLQIWRMSDLVYRDKEIVMEELRQHNERC